MRDRLSFVRFLGLALQDKVPDAKACPELDSGTVWLYREQLSQAGAMDASSRYTYVVIVPLRVHCGHCISLVSLLSF